MFKASRFFKVLKLLSMTLNVLIFNDNEDQTLSGHVGYKAQTKGTWPWLLAEKVINTIFFFDPNHCRTSIEWDEVNGNISNKQNN